MTQIRRDYWLELGFKQAVQQKVITKDEAKAKLKEFLEWSDSEANSIVGWW